MSQQAQRIPNDGIVRVFRETAGRRGSGVCVVRGLTISDREMEDLASELKKTCGAGGTVKDRAIEIQGDHHRDKVVDLLRKRGWKVKKAGG